MDERKQEIIQWLNKLESYAIQNQFSSRFTSRIYECKDELCSTNAQVDTICTKVEELLQSMERKILPNLSGNADKEQYELVRQMKLQVKKMVQRCHDDNLQAMDELDIRKQSLLNKCIMHMHDMVKSAAHKEDIEEEARYLQFYENVAYEYERNSISVISDMLENMNQNYSHMVEHMGGLVQNVNSDDTKLINGKNLYELETKRTTLVKKVLSEVQVGNKGKEKILSFAQKTGIKIRKIVKGAELKRKICAMLPFLILLGIMLENLITNSFEATNAEINVDNAMNIFNWFTNLFGLQTILASLNVVGMSAFFVIIAIVLIVVVLYIIYIKCLKKSCHNFICKKSAAYLEKELLVFEQSGCMRQALEEEIQNAAEEYELWNVTLLNDIFSFTESDVQENKTNEFTALMEEWKHIELEQRIR